MPAGFQAWDGAGNQTVDITDSLIKYLNFAESGATAVTVADAVITPATAIYQSAPQVENVEATDAEVEVTPGIVEVKSGTATRTLVAFF